MAEPLPRYQKAGVLLRDIPRIDFAGSREAARTSQALSSRLDQLSDWALKDAAEKAKEEGLQYGAENPVTVQQLNDATDIGIDPKKLFQQRGTVFGDAARAAQVSTITADLELDAHSRLNQLKTGVVTGQVDIIEARGQVQAMLDGYGKSLVGIDPKASLKLRASVGTAANSAWQSMTNEHAKREGERKKIAVDTWLDTVVADTVRSHIEAGDTRDPVTGKPITPNDRINATVRNTLVNQLLGIGDDVFARQAAVRFETIVKEARIDSLVQFASSPLFSRDRTGKFDPVGAVQRLDKGDFGHYTSTYRAMPSNEQAKVRTALRQAAADRWTADQHVDKETKDADTREVNKLVTEYPRANPARSKAILGRLGDIATTSGAISGQAINSLIKSRKEEGAGQANEVGEFRLRTEVLNGSVRTPEELWARAGRYGMKPKQANEVLGFFISRQNRSETEADRRIRLAAGLAPGVLNPAAGRAEAYINLTRQADEQYRLAEEAHRGNPAKHPPPDREAIAELIVKKRQESPHMRAIEQTLKDLNDQYGPQGARKKTGVTFSEESNPQDVERALKEAKVPAAEAADIVARLRALEQRRRQLNQLRN